MIPKVNLYLTGYLKHMKKSLISIFQYNTNINDTNWSGNRLNSTKQKHGLSSGLIAEYLFLNTDLKFVFY